MSYSAILYVYACNPYARSRTPVAVAVALHCVSVQLVLCFFFSAVWMDDWRTKWLTMLSQPAI